MEDFEIRKKLVACEVDLNLLYEIERYLYKATGEHEVLVSTLMSGSLAEKLFNRLEDYTEAEIPDDISSIVLRLTNESTSDNVRLSFSDESNKSQLNLRLTGNDAKPRALEIVRKIEEILNEKKAITRFVHSGFGYPLFVLIAVFPAAFLARNIVSAFSALDAFFTIFASTVYTLVMVFIIRQIIPYSIFDSRRNRKIKRIGGYTVNSIATIVVVVALTALWMTVIRD
jgi:hypothetical protein